MDDQGIQKDDLEEYLAARGYVVAGQLAPYATSEEVAAVKAAFEPLALAALVRDAQGDQHVREGNFFTNASPEDSSRCADWVLDDTGGAEAAKACGRLVDAAIFGWPQ